VDSPIVDVQAVQAYAQVVRPILRDNCYGCHGATRQKGGLRMDDTLLLMKGGKDGVVIRRGNGGASELIKRLLLPEEDEHHMPPKEKKQLNERQILLLHWWIDQGAELGRRVAELKQPDSVRPALLSLQGARPRVVSESDVPAEVVEAADERALEALRAKGVRVMAVARGSNWLEVDASGELRAGQSGAAGGSGPAGSSGAVGESGPVGAVGKSGHAGGSALREAGVGQLEVVVKLLPPVKKQLIALKVDHTGVGDSALAVIGQCGALRSLNLAGTRVTDVGLAQLRGLRELRVLNLVGTGVSAAGVAGLGGLAKLRAVYLYKTRVSSRDWVELRKVFPKVMIDTGGYSLPALVTDTAVVRQGKAINN